MRIVVKIGGAQLEEDGARTAFARSLAGARAAGHELFVVHGGGNQIRELSKRMGLAERQVEGLRVTDSETAPVVLMVLAGLVNRRLVASLCSAGVPAVGVCGADGGIFDARKLKAGGADIGFVGEIRHVRKQLLESLSFSDGCP
jgi:acetylglutamate kinase